MCPRWASYALSAKNLALLLSYCSVALSTLATTKAEGAPAMPVQSNEALLIAILEQCSQSADGHPFMRTSGMIQDLADGGLVVVGHDGRVVTTDKGKSVLNVLTTAKEERRKRRKRNFAH